MSKKYTAIIVDDEPIIRMDMKEMLTNAGYEVIGEGIDGYEAIELCCRLKPDIVLLDIKMPELDGLSAAKIISKECLETAIILLTAYNKSEYIDQAKDCRISSYLVKPIDENQLLMNVELAVSRNKEMSNYLHNVEEVKAQLETRKIVEKAKGLLMKHKSLDEESAYKHIREISKKRNLSMRKVADIILKQYGE